MLYAIYKGRVRTCPHGQRDVIYLVSTAETLADLGVRFAFTDGHGIMAVTRFFDDLGDIGEVDWGIMATRYWRDTNDDPDRKRRRQAEFLAYEFVPWSVFQGVAVRRASQIAAIRELLDAAGRDTPARAKPEWYY
jgi:hypothetical protein